MKKVLAVVVAVMLLAAMIVPAAVSAYETPAEVTAAGAVEIGVWPMAAGAYDPSLDGKGLKDGTHVITCYDFDFTTYLITPKTVPTDIAGYTKVNSPADMTDGTWCVLTITGAPDYSYVLIMGEPTAAAPAEPDAPAASTTPAPAPTTPSVPRTADSDMMILWTLVAILAVAGTAFVVKAKKN